MPDCFYIPKETLNLPPCSLDIIKITDKIFFNLPHNAMRMFENEDFTNSPIAPISFY